MQSSMSGHTSFGGRCRHPDGVLAGFALENQVQEVKVGPCFVWLFPGVRSLECFTDVAYMKAFGRPVLWKSETQDAVTTSSTEAESAKEEYALSSHCHYHSGDGSGFIPCSPGLALPQASRRKANGRRTMFSQG